MKVKMAYGVLTVRDGSMLANGYLIELGDIDLQEDSFGTMSWTSQQ